MPPNSKSKTTKPGGWCIYCGARNPEYCKGGDEQGRCRFNDNPISKHQQDDADVRKPAAWLEAKGGQAVIPEGVVLPNGTNTVPVFDPAEPRHLSGVERRMMDGALRQSLKIIPDRMTGIESAALAFLFWVTHNEFTDPENMLVCAEWSNLCGALGEPMQMAGSALKDQIP